MTGLAKTKTISLNMLVYLFIAIFAAQIAGSPICRAADTAGGRFIFILDASGSMAAKIQGKPKIDVAKEVLSSLIKDLPETTSVGLVAYGHRQKGDCNDVEELAPIAPVNKASLINQIASLHPKGMTPLSYSIQQVAEGLKGKAPDTTIILVSDGEETCKGDPCAVVRELKAAGVKFVLHVIGFDVGEKEKKQLNCIAKAGDGFYFTARNAGELKLAAKQAVEKKEPPKSTLTIKALRNGQPLQARYEVFKTEEETAKQGGKIGAGITEKGGTTLTLPPGTYNLVVENSEDTLKPTVAFEGVAIGIGENVEKVAEFSGGTLIVKALRNGVSVNASCSIYKAGGDQEKGRERITGGATDGKGKEFKLAPGGYEVIVEDLEDANRPTLTFQNVLIEAGKTVEKVAEFSGGALIVKALKNGKPFQAFCIVYKTNEDEDKEKEKAAEAWIELEGTQFKLTTGTYDVVVVNQEDTIRPTVSFQGVVIEAGKTVEKTADFSGGGLKVSALRNGKSFSAEMVVFNTAPDGSQKKERVVANWTGVEGKTVKLPPGVYDLMVKNHEDAGKPELVFPGIAIEMGKTVEKTADFSGGVLKVSALRNGKPFSAEVMVFKAVQDGDQKKERIVANWTGTEGVVLKLPPGVYGMMVKNHEDAGKPELSFSAITVEAGKTVEKTADFTGGGLKVIALRNGKPFSAEAVILKTVQDGDQKKERIVANWTGTAGIQFKLPPGVYDLMVKNHEDAGKPEQTFPGITVEAGKSAERTVEFTGGGLKVTALRNGKPFSAEAVVLKAAQDDDQKKERIIANWTGTAGIQFSLPPGVYDLMVKNHEDAGKPEQTFPGITVEAGRITEKTVEFSGGGLKVIAVHNGKPFSAEAVVFKAASDGDQKKERVAGNWTGTAGIQFKLPPGVYDLTVKSHEDAGKPEQAFPSITVEAGKIVEKSVEFPRGASK